MMARWMVALVGMALWFLTGCVAAADVAQLAHAAQDPMQFQATQWCERPPSGCRPAVKAKGTVMGNTPAVLRAYMDAHREAPPQVLVLDSIGGVFNSAIVAGLMVRHYGLDTAVDDGAVCESACFYVFLGGVQRTVRTQGLLAVHVNEFHSDNPLSGTREAAGTVYQARDLTASAREATVEVAIQIKYLAAMGIRPEALDEVFRSFGPPVAITPTCQAWLRLTTTTVAPTINPCAGADGIPAAMGVGVGEEGASISLDEANRMLGHGQP